MKTERPRARDDPSGVRAKGQTVGLKGDPVGDLLERISDGFVALDTDWRYTYVNQQAAELFGRQPEHLVGRHIWTVFPEGVGQPFQLAYERAMSEQVFIKMENYYEPWDRWFENRIYPSPNGLSIFFHEITERKHAEQDAHESAELLKGQNQVLAAIARGEPLTRTLDLLVRVIEAQCPVLLCSILLLDSDRLHVRHGAGPSLPATFTGAVDGQCIGPRAGSCGTAAFRGEAVVAEDIATDPLWDDYRDVALAHGLRACWSTPIFDEQRLVLGTFALYFRERGRPDERHWKLIELATATAAIAIIKHRETEALRASEERLRLAVTGGQVGIWEWHVDTNRLVWSAELKRMFGWPTTADDLTLQMFMDAVDPEDRGRVEATLQRAVTEAANRTVEFRIVRPDGSLRWIAATGGRGEYDAAGRAVRMLGVGLDITERKRADEEISRREAQLGEAQRIAHIGSYEWDVSTNIVHRSEELFRIFGVPPDQFEPTFEGYLQRVHPEDRSTTSTIIQEAFRERSPFEFEERIVRPDGAIRLLHSQGKWILDNLQQPVSLVGICHDITERRQAEDQLRRSEEQALALLEQRVATRTAELHEKNLELEDQISQRKRVAELLRTRNEELKAFAYTVSHDLKAPLRGIAGYAQELDRRHRTGLDERAAWCITQILTATRSLDRLIEDLLHYSRLDAETPSRTDVDLADMLEAILADRKAAIVERHAEVADNLSVKRVCTWERGLLQTMTNLIDNALKYSRDAWPPRIQVASEQLPGAVRITVSDNGIGFDMKYHDRIFGLFNRLVRQEDFEGTGAGLAIVKKVIEKMGGTIRAESMPGSGTTFFVELPDAEQPEPFAHGTQ
jgi:PAS domain S-box-containing protein